MLRRLGRTVEMVRYPDEFHLLLSVGRPDRRVDRLERIVDWFERYL
jgi:dipeptidyl aminopeptidase/acylaminoacyl peptidase